MSDNKAPVSEYRPEYRVLARKYRPRNFDELIGQDALVRTLKNAIDSGRVAHAFMLTGVRGVGKTTTARIIAKALNYKGPDGKSGPTTGSTDDCSLCRAITEDRHPDVIEMDAASHTGVENMREILDGVRYAPTEARYKIYVIDEVHMLSKSAFNALLKTLEEPPPHVKFIFATTEIRKVPLTVLSRCQRFDLRRVDIPTLSDHFLNICKKEKVKAEDEAIAQIARAADGSVRDGLSLLDQAISLGGDKISAQLVTDMLGLGDRGRTLDLLEKALTGDMPEALKIMDEMYRSGGDPLVLIQDLLDFTHLLTKIRAIPKAKNDDKRLVALAAELSMPTLGRTWQILLKGLNEVQNAPAPHAAAEMIIIRLAYAADLPDPVDLIRKLKDQPASTNGQTMVASAPPRDYAPVARSPKGSTQAALAPEPQIQGEHAVRNLEDIVSLLGEAGEVMLSSQIYQSVHLVRLEEGRLEIRPHEHAPPKLAQELGPILTKLTGRRWMVSISGLPGEPTLAERKQNARAAEFAEALALPEVAQILSIFPGAQLTDITARDENKD
ncbi:MAG TPA: DNA polymerase III subunit gamma/tau [Alphaproteobacteria bacterium]|nr:DNA polymerase III subunit gamma/tau [Micavibrio sp.]HQX26801.1 DNA polymerase III subunit gamma/tau [Alphaproteobacteria bacterium]